MTAIALFAYLQVLDFLTTVAFLLHGVGEGNPMVRLAVRIAPSPLLGLAIVKAAALALGIWAWRQQRERLLKRANVLFAVVVVWNIAMIIAVSAQQA